MNKQSSSNYLRLAEVLSRTGLSKSHLHRLRVRGEFPNPLKRPGKWPIWGEAEIEAWVAEAARQKSEKKPGFDDGYKAGYQRGQAEAQSELCDRLCEMGELQTKVHQVCSHILLLANGLRFPATDRKTRTDLWWFMYVDHAAKEIAALAKSMSVIKGVVEFEEDLPVAARPE